MAAPKRLVLDEEDLYEICEAVDYWAGTSEIAQRLWPDLMDLRPGDRIEIVREKEREQ